MGYVLPMSRKRVKTAANAAANADAPITGVAAGSRGTAANLDDTQVMRTEDLQAAAPSWLDDDGPVAASEQEAPPAAVPARPVVAQPPRAKPRRAQPRRAASSASAGSAPVWPVWRNRSAPALAGVAALLVLLLIAGSGFLSQLDLGSGTGPEPAGSANALIEAAPSPTSEPNQGKGGTGKCHGRGHNCQGNGD